MTFDEVYEEYYEVAGQSLDETEFLNVKKYSTDDIDKLI